VTVWTAATLVCYGLTLTVLSDDVFLLAMPGLIGLATLSCLAVLRVLNRPLRRTGAPSPTDGTEYRGVVRQHYAALARRYGALLLTAVALAAIPVLTQISYFFPLIAVAMLTAVAGTTFVLDQVRWLRRCARVLLVYDVEFRSPVRTVSVGTRGRRYLRPGPGTPVMTARTPIGDESWPAGITDGVWFAGDDSFGGALLVPGSGELMCLQPRDWPDLADERARAGAERRAKAKAGGIDSRAL
jgi:hypothetical protein